MFQPGDCDLAAVGTVDFSTLSPVAGPYGAMVFECGMKLNFVKPTTQELITGDWTVEVQRHGQKWDDVW